METLSPVCGGACPACTIPCKHGPEIDWERHAFARDFAMHRCRACGRRWGYVR